MRCDGGNPASRRAACRTYGAADFQKVPPFGSEARVSRENPRGISQELESVLKPAECRIGTDFSVGQGDLTQESWRISSQINAVPAEKGALRRRFDGFKADSSMCRNQDGYRQNSRGFSLPPGRNRA